MRDIEFKLGDRVRVTSTYMSERVTDEIGTIVLIRGRNGTSHPYGVAFDKEAPHRHDLYTSCDKAKVWPIILNKFELDDEEDCYRLKERTGYFLPGGYLTLAELKYDPTQQGDTDDDI